MKKNKRFEKNFLLIGTRCFLPILLLYSILEVCLAGQTGLSTGVNADGIAVWGEYGSDISQPPVFFINLKFNPPNTNVSGITGLRITKSFPPWLMQNPPAIYYWASNCFCGLVELRDAAGHEIPLLKPELNSPEAYPASYSLTEATHILAHIYSGGSGEYPTPIYGTSTGKSWEINLYFKISSPGAYTLTVWPKIYKRLSLTVTNDTCARLDLPKVTIPIQWTGDPRY